MKYVDIRDLPPCSFSPQCLRLLDDLDMPAAVSAPTRFAYIEDLQDERQLRQIRSHVSTCPTCSALLAEARHTRTEQRTMLYHFLLANERQIPSTSSAIFEAIRQEKAQEDEEEEARRIRARSQNLTLCAPPVEPENAPILSPVSSHSRPLQLRSLFQNILTLATVAAVILAAVGLLNRFTGQSSTNQSASSSHPPTQGGSAVNNYGWDTMVIGLTVLSAAGMVKSFTFYTYNAPSGQMDMQESLTQDFSAVDAAGISPDGQSLLYTTNSPAQQKTYTTYSSPATLRPFYQLDASVGGNAVWMDADHVLVQNTAGMVVELDTNTQSGIPQQTWPLKTGRLAFYHQPFLYFIGAEDSDVNALYRVNLAEANVMPQQVTKAMHDTRFWLSPDGTTVFYTNQGSSGEQGIYAVGSDGTNDRLLRAGPGIPIGYAENNALMLLQQVDNRLEVIQMGATPTQPERVVLTNAAPGASSLCGPGGIAAIIKLCDQSIALEPYGHGLLLHVYYANGSHGLVYDDLVAGTSRTIRSLPTDTGVQLPGWSKMSTPATSLSNQPALLCA